MYTSVLFLYISFPHCLYSYQMYLYSKGHRHWRQHFNGENCDGSVHHTEGGRPWRWSWGHQCSYWRYGGPQWFGGHCDCLCSVIWTDKLSEPELPTRAQMYFWSPAEDSTEAGWAEVVIQGTVPEEQAYSWSLMTDSTMAFVYISANADFCFWKFKIRREMFQQTMWLIFDTKVLSLREHCFNWSWKDWRHCVSQQLSFTVAYCGDA